MIILDTIINGSKVGSMVLNHKSSPLVAPLIVAIGNRNINIKNNIKKILNNNLFEMCIETPHCYVLEPDLMVNTYLCGGCLFIPK